MGEKYDPDWIMHKTSEIGYTTDGRRNKVILKRVFEKVQSLFFLFDKDLKIEKEIHKIIKYKYYYFIYLRSATSYLNVYCVHLQFLIASYNLLS